MSQNYQYPTTMPAAAGLNSANAGYLSRSNNPSQTFSVASALAGSGFNPRIATYGGYETYQYTSTGNNASPAIGVSSMISGITGNNMLNAASGGGGGLISGGGASGGGVSTGFEYLQPPASTNLTQRQSQQVQTSAVGDALTAADFIYKNDYNYALSNQQISQQIAADLITLNRAASGGTGGQPSTVATSSIQQAQQQQQQAASNNNNNNNVLSANLSSIEAAILRSTVPIEIAETEEITVNGQRGIWANKSEVVNWRGLMPITEYAINQDAQPEVITKRSNQQLVYQQEVAIRYLRPPTPPPPGEIIIQQETNTVTPPAPPLIIRQQPPRPITPQPLVVREAPPPPPAQVGRKVITISGKRIPPPPRKVVIERLAPLPSKPQSVIIERWLPYSQVKRRVIFQKANTNDPVVVKPRNVIIQWEAPQVTIKKEFKDLGVIRANPSEYVARYGTTLKAARELPPFVLEIKPPAGVILAADHQYNSIYELEGDVQALRLVDLDREGLSEYRQLVNRLSAEQSVPVLHTSSLDTPNSIAGAVTTAINSLQAAGVPPQPVTGAQINEIFNSVDSDQNGRIRIDEAEKLLLRLNSRLGRRYGEDDVKRFFDSLDLNKDGQIGLIEFRRAFESQL